MEDVKKTRRSGGGTYCVVKNCRSNSVNKTFSLFRFPADHKRCIQWLTNCKRLDLLEKGLDHIHKYKKICGKHFEATMFYNFLKTRLGDHAVPTIFNDSNTQRTIEPENEILEVKPDIEISHFEPQDFILISHMKQQLTEPKKDVPLKKSPHLPSILSRKSSKKPTAPAPSEEKSTETIDDTASTPLYISTSRLCNKGSIVSASKKTSKELTIEEKNESVSKKTPLSSSILSTLLSNKRIAESLPSKIPDMDTTDQIFEKPACWSVAVQTSKKLYKDPLKKRISSPRKRTKKVCASQAEKKDEIEANIATTSRVILPSEAGTTTCSVSTQRSSISSKEPLAPKYLKYIVPTTPKEPVSRKESSVNMKPNLRTNVANKQTSTIAVQTCSNESIMISASCKESTNVTAAKHPMIKLVKFCIVPDDQCISNDKSTAKSEASLLEFLKFNVVPNSQTSTVQTSTNMNARKATMPSDLKASVVTCSSTDETSFHNYSKKEQAQTSSKSTRCIATTTATIPSVVEASVGDDTKCTSTHVESNSFHNYWKKEHAQTSSESINIATATSVNMPSVVEASVNDGISAVETCCFHNYSKKEQVQTSSKEESTNCITSTTDTMTSVVTDTCSAIEVEIDDFHNYSKKRKLDNSLEIENNVCVKKKKNYLVNIEPKDIVSTSTTVPIVVGALDITDTPNSSVQTSQEAAELVSTTQPSTTQIQMLKFIKLHILPGISSVQTSFNKSVSGARLSGIATTSKALGKASVSRSSATIQNRRRFSNDSQRKRKLQAKLRAKKAKKPLSPQKKRNEEIRDLIRLSEMFLPPTLVSIIRSQVFSTGKSDKGSRYDEDLKQFAQTIYYLGPRVYKFIAKCINLPCERTLRRATKKQQSTDILRNRLEENQEITNAINSVIESTAQDIMEMPIIISNENNDATTMLNQIT